MHGSSAARMTSDRSVSGDAEMQLSNTPVSPTSITTINQMFKIRPVRRTFTGYVVFVLLVFISVKTKFLASNFVARSVRLSDKLHK